MRSKERVKPLGLFVVLLFLVSAASVGFIFKGGVAPPVKAEPNGPLVYLFKDEFGSVGLAQWTGYSDPPTFSSLYGYNSSSASFGSYGWISTHFSPGNQSTVYLTYYLSTVPGGTDFEASLASSDGSEILTVLVNGGEMFFSATVNGTAALTNYDAGKSVSNYVFHQITLETSNFSGGLNYQVFLDGSQVYMASIDYPSSSLSILKFDELGWGTTLSNVAVYEYLPNPFHYEGLDFQSLDSMTGGSVYLNGSLITGANQDSYVVVGDTANITAVPSQGYFFGGWALGNDSNLANPLYLKITETQFLIDNAIDIYWTFNKTVTVSGVNYLSDGNQWAESNATLAGDFAFFNATGVRHISIRVMWSCMEPTIGSINPTDLYNVKRVLQIAQEFGLLVDVTFWTQFGYSLGLPGYIHSYFDLIQNSTAQTLYLNYLALVVNDLKGYPVIESWAVMNEPWYNTPSQRAPFETFLASCYSRVKGLDPTRLVICRFTLSFTPASGLFSQEMYRVFDEFAVTVYLDPNNPGSLVYNSNWADWNQLVSDLNGLNQRLIVIEFGSNSTNNSYQEAYIAGLLTVFNSTGIVNLAYCWAWQTRPISGPTSESFNICGADDTARPAYTPLTWYPDLSLPGYLQVSPPSNPSNVTNPNPSPGNTTVTNPADPMPAFQSHIVPSYVLMNGSETDNWQVAVNSDYVLVIRNNVTASGSGYWLQISVWNDSSNSYGGDFVLNYVNASYVQINGVNNEPVHYLAVTGGEIDVYAFHSNESIVFVSGSNQVSGNGGGHGVYPSNSFPNLIETTNGDGNFTGGKVFYQLVPTWNLAAVLNNTHVVPASNVTAGDLWPISVSSDYELTVNDSLTGSSPALAVEVGGSQALASEMQLYLSGSTLSGSWSDGVLSPGLTVTGGVFEVYVFHSNDSIVFVSGSDRVSKSATFPSSWPTAIYTSLADGSVSGGSVSYQLDPILNDEILVTNLTTNYPSIEYNVPNGFGYMVANMFYEKNGSADLSSPVISGAFNLSGPWGPTEGVFYPSYSLEYANGSNLVIPNAWVFPFFPDPNGENETRVWTYSTITGRDGQGKNNVVSLASQTVYFDKIVVASKGVYPTRPSEGETVTFYWTFRSYLRPDLYFVNASPYDYVGVRVNGSEVENSATWNNVSKRWEYQARLPYVVGGSVNVNLTTDCWWTLLSLEGDLGLSANETVAVAGSLGSPTNQTTVTSPVTGENPWGIAEANNYDPNNPNPSGSVTYSALEVANIPANSGWESPQGNLTNTINGFLKFDLSGLPSDAVITGATIELSNAVNGLPANYVQFFGSSPYSTYPYSPPEYWVANSVNWDHQPEVSRPLGVFLVPGNNNGSETVFTENYSSPQITSWVQDSFFNGTPASFELVANNATLNDLLFALHSFGYGAVDPTLFVSYYLSGSPGGPPSSGFTAVITLNGPTICYLGTATSLSWTVRLNGYAVPIYEMTVTKNGVFFANVTESSRWLTMYSPSVASRQIFNVSGFSDPAGDGYTVTPLTVDWIASTGKHGGGGPVINNNSTTPTNSTKPTNSTTGPSKGTGGSGTAFSIGGFVTFASQVLPWWGWIIILLLICALCARAVYNWYNNKKRGPNPNRISESRPRLNARGGRRSRS
jgi:hypothetical protein